MLSKSKYILLLLMNTSDKEDKIMKRFLVKAAKAFVAVLPVVAMFSVTVSANTIASPVFGQPVPPASLKKHRKF